MAASTEAPLRARSIATRALLIAVAGCLLVLGFPGTSYGATEEVTIRDNRFEPQEIRIEPGDSVLWTNRGLRPHDVTSDERGAFASGGLETGDTFSRRFREEGRYPYFCALHGARGGVGMRGVVVVGDPPPTGGEGEKDPRDRLRVPQDYRTVQKAVDAATPGSTVVISPGVYRAPVTVRTDDLVLRGVDRFRTTLHGGDTRADGITIDGADGVKIKNLTIRNFLGSGILFKDATRYLAARIDSIKNRTFGIRAMGSYDGVIKRSFGYGSGDAAFSVAHCLRCSTLIDGVEATTNHFGFASVNATGVVVRGSTFSGNGLGILSSTAPSEALAPGRGTTLVGNTLASNNYETIPAAGTSETYGIPFGTGIWLAGTRNDLVQDNVVTGNRSYGILTSPSFDLGTPAFNTRVVGNDVRASGLYDLATAGGGENNCWDDNLFATSGPGEIEIIYPCPGRPFTNAPFQPVRDDLEARSASADSRAQIEPPEPNRPHCQRGVRGCRR